MKARYRWSLIAAIYLGGAFFTYGATYNSIMQKDCGVRPEYTSETWNYWWECEYAKRQYSPPTPFLSAVSWPIYWGSVAAVALTEPLTR